MYLLAKYGDASVVPALVGGLNDPDALVRGEACRLARQDFAPEKRWVRCNRPSKIPTIMSAALAAYGTSGLMGDPGRAWRSCVRC